MTEHATKRGGARPGAGRADPLAEADLAVAGAEGDALAAEDAIEALHAGGDDGPRWAAIAQALPCDLQAELLQLLAKPIAAARARAARALEIRELISAEIAHRRFAGLSEREKSVRLTQEPRRAVCRRSSLGDRLDLILALYGGRAPASETIRQTLIGARRGYRFGPTSLRAKVRETEALDETETDSQS